MRSYPIEASESMVVPCSHCNSGDNGPEPGICHRSSWGRNTRDDQSCHRCDDAAGYVPRGAAGKVLAAAMMGVAQPAVPCSYCEGTGYKRF